MSNQYPDFNGCQYQQQSDPLIELVIRPRERDLGGFSVRRCLPASERAMIGPFIFFDHLGPAEFAPGEGIDVRPHPHINLATVTYLFEGEILHRDSLGHVQPIRPGEINWMTAGRGIVHSERTPPELRQTGHRVHALQLWVALPEGQEEVEPAFEHYSADRLPIREQEGARLRVMVGAAYGLSSPVAVLAKTLYIDIRLDAGTTLPLPDQVGERGLYLVAGAATLGTSSLEPNCMHVLKPGAAAELRASSDCHLVLIGGEPLGRREIWWNFVSSRSERIEQAKADWRQGRFAEVAGETEFIPLPGEE